MIGSAMPHLSKDHVIYNSDLTDPENITLVNKISHVAHKMTGGRNSQFDTRNLKASDLPHYHNTGTDLTPIIPHVLNNMSRRIQDTMYLSNGSIKHKFLDEA